LDSKIFDRCLKKYEKINSESWEDIAKEYPNLFKSGEHLRMCFRNEYRKKGYVVGHPKSQISADGEEILNYKESTEIHGNGNITSDKLIRICEEDSKNPVKVMQMHGFDPNQWNLISCRNNMWHMQKKGGDRLLCYQSKITVAPKKSGEWSTKLVDEIFDKLDKKGHIFNNSIKPRNITKNGKILLLGISDLHLGLLSTNHSTGNEYNAQIAEEVFLETISKIKQEVQGKIFEKIIFLVGNDFLNMDNTRGETNNGTPQENDSIWFDLIDKAIELVIRGINEFLPIAPVDVVYVKSNHDLESFYGIMRVVDVYYRNNSNVNVDYSPLPRKYYQYGKNLFGFSHDIEMKRALDIFTVEAKDQWSSSEHMYWMLAHLHTGMIYEKRGYLEIYRLPTLSGWSRWANNKGYVQTERKTQCFIVDEDKGITNTINIVI
jgi:hypothetical protein